MALVMVLILATLIASCRSEPEASFVIEPTPEAIYKILEPADQESWVFGFSLDPKVPIDTLAIDYLRGETVVYQVRHGAAALETKRTPDGYRDLTGSMARTAKIDAMHLRALRDGKRVAERRVPLIRYAQLRPYVLPARGCWLVSSGHDRGLEHRRWYNRAHFAWDLVVVDGGGNPHRGAGGLQDYYGFGAAIHAPSAGRVVLAEDGHPDLPPGEAGDRAESNYLLIDHGGGEFSKLAHLKQGSLQVKPGDQVSTSQFVARVGNSGMSSGPHLHFHFQRTVLDDDGSITKELPLPVLLSGYTTNGASALVDGGRPRRGDFVCRR